MDRRHRRQRWIRRRCRRHCRLVRPAAWRGLGLGGLTLLVGSGSGSRRQEGRDEERLYPRNAMPFLVWLGAGLVRSFVCFSVCFSSRYGPQATDLNFRQLRASTEGGRGLSDRPQMGTAHSTSCASETNGESIDLLCLTDSYWPKINKEWTVPPNESQRMLRRRPMRARRRRTQQPEDKHANNLAMCKGADVRGTRNGNGVALLRSTSRVRQCGCWYLGTGYDDTTGRQQTQRADMMRNSGKQPDMHFRVSF